VSTDGSAPWTFLSLRGLDALKIGEAACTIGTPRGLEKTLGSGLVSGLREIDARPSR
jgi:hypothetical protein